MDRKISLITSVIILLVLIGAQGSDAWTLLPKKLRRMLVTTPLPNTTAISPSPAPIPEIKSDQHHGLNSTTVTPQKIPANNNSSEVDGKAKSNDAHAHVDKDLDRRVVDEKCDASPVSICTRNQMVACLKHSEKGSQDLVIVIQNEGDRLLNVSVAVPPSIQIPMKELKILGHHVQKIKMSTIAKESLKIVLNVGDGECVLYTGVPISEGNFFQKIPSYANQVTPMHGAYFMFAVTLIVGVTWACCKFGKRGLRGDGGIPYQELEMALPQSVSAVNGDAEEDGWDDNWDDDWDDGGAVKSPGQIVGNPSANGLTSRSSNRDGWENDWDD